MPDNKSASFGKFIFERSPLAPFTEVKGMNRLSVKMLHTVVPIITNKIYGTLLSAFIFTVPELFRKIQTRELVIMGAKAQKNPKKDCLYCACMSLFAI